MESDHRHQARRRGVSRPTLSVVTVVRRASGRLPRRPRVDKFFVHPPRGAALAEARAAPPFGGTKPAHRGQAITAGLPARASVLAAFPALAEEVAALEKIPLAERLRARVDHWRRAFGATHPVVPVIAHGTSFRFNELGNRLLHSSAPPRLATWPLRLGRDEEAAVEAEIRDLVAMRAVEEVPAEEATSAARLVSPIFAIAKKMAPGQRAA